MGIFGHRGAFPPPSTLTVICKPMYQQLAHLYDWPGSLEFTQNILTRDLAIFEAQKIAPSASILDLACGTGTLALSLTKAGYPTIGLDISAPMIAQANSKRDEQDPDHKLAVRFTEGDMRYFLLDEPVDIVVCHYDSLNHLSNETELRGTFLQVAQALKPGGLFLFDLNTLENYKTYWTGRDTYEGPNYRLKTASTFDESQSKASVEFMVDEYNDDGELMHHSETVHEQYFNETAVEKYLMAADFYDISYEAFNPVDDLPQDFPLKSFWQCKRR
jgi:ubiquinone/menaquinone biosynthesis C-methylase UbiE